MYILRQGLQNAGVVVYKSPNLPSPDHTLSPALSSLLTQLVTIPNEALSLGALSIQQQGRKEINGAESQNPNPFHATTAKASPSRRRLVIPKSPPPQIGAKVVKKYGGSNKRKRKSIQTNIL